MLGGGPLPTDFANRRAKSLAIVLIWNSGFLLGGDSLPPDFTNRYEKSLDIVLTRYLHVPIDV